MCIYVFQFKWVYIPYLNYPFIYRTIGGCQTAKLPALFFSRTAVDRLLQRVNCWTFHRDPWKKHHLNMASMAIHGKKHMEKHHDQPANLGGYAIFRPAWKLSLQFAPRDGNVSISRWKLLSFQLVCSKIWPTHPPAVQHLPNHLGSVAPQNRTGLSNKW